MKCHDESNIVLTLLSAEGLNVNQLGYEALSDVCIGSEAGFRSVDLNGSFVC